MALHTVSPLLPVTGCAGLSCFRVTVATEAGGRVDPRINPVATQVISPVWHAPVGLGRTFDTRFQFNTSGMTIVTEATRVAHAADLSLSVGGLAMIFAKIDRMIKLGKIEILIT